MIWDTRVAVLRCPCVSTSLSRLAGERGGVGRQRGLVILLPSEVVGPLADTFSSFRSRLCPLAPFASRKPMVHLTSCMAVYLWVLNVFWLHTLGNAILCVLALNSEQPALLQVCACMS